MQLAKRYGGAHALPAVATAPERETIWEAGHYYVSKGPTVWSRIGWQILTEQAGPKESRMLFLDDVHPIEEVGEHERELEQIHFIPDPEPTHIITESAVLADAHEALKLLSSLSFSRRHRAMQSGASKIWRCSGHALTKPGGEPLCLFYDLGLAWRKRQLGFTRAVNILPEAFALEQQRLRQIVRKAIPDLVLDVILFDIEGNWRWMSPTNADIMW